MKQSFRQSLDQTKYFEDAYNSRNNVKNKFRNYILQKQGLQESVKEIYKPLLESQTKTLQSELWCSVL
jgi:hypothetical protein